MNKALTIAKFTYREIIKSKILIGVIVLSFIVALASMIAAEFTYGTPERVALDVGLGLLTLSNVGMSIFLGVMLISKEMENRTVYMILSRPVSRASFLFGKLIGLGLVIITSTLILGGATLLVFVINGGQINSLILLTIIFSLLESLIVLLSVTLLSLIANQVISVLSTLGIYFSGHAIEEVLKLPFVEKQIWLSQGLNYYSHIMPNFSKLNIKSYVLYNAFLPEAYVSKGLIYGAAYCGLLFTLSLIVINNKDLN
jgi:ABC-type transport system involved in multi-copper enzyme maturation permease subunit